MAGGRSGSETGVCKYCSQNVVINGAKCVRCVECSSVYHSACSERLKTRKVVDPEKNLIECCTGVDVPTAEDKLSDVEEVKEYRLEVKYLRALLAEKDARIEDLIKINSLLEHKIGYMEKVHGNSADKQALEKKRQIRAKIFRLQYPVQVKHL